MGELSDYVTVRQAAEILELSASRVKQFIGAGRLPSVMVGQQRMMLRADVEAFKAIPRQKRGRKPAAKKRRQP